MRKFLRPLAVAVVACLAPSAQALTATIKREVPLLFPGVYLKNTPVQLAPGDFSSIAYDGTQIWLVDRAAYTVRRFDAVDNSLKGTIGNITEARKLVFDGTFMWVFTLDAKAYKYNDKGQLQPGFPITLSGGVSGAAFDGDYIWASTSAGDLARIDVATRAVTNFPVAADGSVAFDGKDLWITTPGSGTTKVSGTTGALLMYDPALGGANGTNGIAFDGQYIWVLSDMSGDTVYKVDVTTNQIVATVLAYPGVHTLAFDGTLIWVVCTNSDMIVKIDTRTNQIVGTIQLPTGSEAYDIAFDGTHMWVTTMASGRIHKFVAHF